MPTFTPAATCYEVPGSFQEGLSENGPTASIRLYCAFADRWTIVNDLLGTPRAWPYSVGTYMPLIAKSANIVPQKEEVSVTGQAYNWLNAEIDVTYGIPSLEDRVTMSEELDPSGQFLTIEPSNLAWGAADGDALKDEEAPGFQDVTTVWRITRYRQATIPSYLDTLYGSTNNGTIAPATLTGFSFAAERVMLASWKAKRSKNLLLAGGSDKWDVTVELGIKKNSWNDYFRTKSNAYDSIYTRAGSRITLYPPADFSAVIAP